MLTGKELYFIVGLGMLLLMIFIPLKTKYRLLFIFSGAYLMLSYFLPDTRIYQIISIIVLITPFVIIRIKKDDFLKEK